MRLEIGIIFLQLVLGSSWASPLPQINGDQENTYLPRRAVQQLQGAQSSDSNLRLGGSEEILNLTPPAQLPAVVSDGTVRAVVSTNAQEVPDSYMNVRLTSSSSGGNIASALVNPNEYGETVPGAFSNLNSYAAYNSNYQSTV